MTADTKHVYEAVFNDYSKKIRQYISGRVSSSHDVDDLVSSVFLKIFEKWDSFDESRSCLSTWIYTITRNTVIDYYRTLRVSGELPETLAFAETVEDIILQEESLNMLADALEQLTLRERNVVLLHYYRGLSLKEISKQMRLSYATIKLAHSGALHQLRLLLK